MQIFEADFSCSSWFSTSAKKLIKKILDPNANCVLLSVAIIFYSFYSTSVGLITVYHRFVACVENSYFGAH
jgi:hypothetical protein